MKKVLAILLAILMMAAFVPAFAVSADSAEVETPTLDEAIEDKQKLVAFDYWSDTLADYQTFSFGAWELGYGCGFFDGNVGFNNPTAKTLLRGVDKEDVLTYVDGKLVEQAPAHSGFFADGYGGRYQLAIVGASFKKDVPSVVTLVFGESGYYTQFTVTPDAVNLGVDSADVQIRGSAATVTVVSAEVAAAYTVGEEVKARLHDDHNPERILTVASVSGNTVVFTCSNFASTDKTILEVGFGTDKAFSALVDVNRPNDAVIASPADGDILNAYIQSRSVDSDLMDYRFILNFDGLKLTEGYAAGTSVAQTAKLSIVFNTGDSTKAYTCDLGDLTYYKEIVADGARYVPAGYNDVLLGLTITDIPVLAWNSVKISVTAGENTIYTSALTPNYERDNRTTTAGYVWIYGEQNIQASTGKNSGGESSPYLFDKTGSKYGYGSGGADQTITWEYASPKTVAMFAIYTGNDTGNDDATGRNPNRWEFYGSTDGESYTLIHSITNPTLVREGGGAFFEIDSPVAYQYYKITFGTNNDYFQIGEIKLFEVATDAAYDKSTAEKLPAPATKTADPAATYEEYGEGVAEVFDDNNGSKYGHYSNCSLVTFTWSYDQAYTATIYDVVTGNDSLRANRNPESWKLYGSTDGENWVLIDSVVYTANLSSDVATYAIDEPGAYQHYKIEFSVANHWFQIAEVRLYK